MYLLLIHLIVALLLPLATALTDPPKTYLNGTANPFYPCGYTDAQKAACPYRCYQESGASTAPTWSLLPNCYNDMTEINRLLKTDHICTQCEPPSKFQPYDYPGGCQPLSDYFAGGYPSQCGFVNHRLRDCAVCISSIPRNISLRLADEVVKHVSAVQSLLTHASQLKMMPN